MRVLISADMEGVTGVTFPDDVEPGSTRWSYHRKFFTGDVNAAVRGFFDAGADEVLVNDSHADKRNLLLDELDPRATMLIGTHKPWSMMEGIDRGYDAIAHGHAARRHATVIGSAMGGSKSRRRERRSGQCYVAAAGAAQGVWPFDVSRHERRGVCGEHRHRAASNSADKSDP